MTILAVDDERRALDDLKSMILDAAQKADVAAFLKAADALAYARENRVDVAFLDIEMPGMNGLLLAKSLKDLNGSTNIIFVTGYSHYMEHAFGMYASGYVTKPLDTERVARELDNLRNPVRPPDQGVRVQCFGNFEVFADGRPVVFGRPRAKEILAYLVDRKGAGVTKKELASVLFEDEFYSHSIQSHLYVLITEMIHTLKAAGADNIVIRKRGQYSVDPRQFKCDLYSFEQGEAWGVNSYHGEYMANYSWGEWKAEFLDKHQNRSHPV